MQTTTKWKTSNSSSLSFSNLNAMRTTYYLLPFRQAWWRGLKPLILQVVTSRRLDCSMISTIVFLSLTIASWRGVSPSWSYKNSKEENGSFSHEWRQNRHAIQFMTILFLKNRFVQVFEVKRLRIQREPLLNFVVVQSDFSVAVIVRWDSVMHSF